MNSDEFSPELLLGAAGIGVVAGLRSMTGSGTVEPGGSDRFHRNGRNAVRVLVHSACRRHHNRGGGSGTHCRQAAFHADRTSAVPLLARAVSGGLAGAALSAARKKDWIPGAAVGALAAVVGAFAGYLFRRTATKNGSAPDLVVALAEDAITIGLGIYVLRNEAAQSAAITPL